MTISIQGFPGHAGRPGQVGGSLPRGASVKFGKSIDSKNKAAVDVALAYLKESDLPKGLTLHVSDMPTRYGTSRGTDVYLDSGMLKKEHPIFTAAVIFHEGVHSRNFIEKRKYTPSQDEFQARFKTKMWASLKLSSTVPAKEQAALKRIIKESTTS